MGKRKRRRSSEFRRYWRDFNPLANFRLITRNLLGDCRAAIVIILYIVPVALAVSLLTGQAFSGNILGPLSAVRTAVFVMLIAALLGGASTTVSGPGLIMALAAAVVIQQEGTSTSRYVVLIFLIAALLQLLAALAKRVRFVTYVPQPVISGFSNACGVAVLLFAAHLMLGHNPFSEKLRFFPAFPAVGQVLPFFQPVNLYSLAAAATTVVLAWLFGRRIRAFPGVLLAMVVVTAAIYTYVHFGGVPVETFGVTFASAKAKVAYFVGPASRGITLLEVLLPAVIIAFLGMAQSMSTADTCDNLGHTLHDSNREIWGLGLANIVGAFCGALPGAGQVQTSTAGLRYGSRTPLAAVLGAILLAVLVAFAAGYLHFLPLAPVAGALFLMGFNLFDVTPFKRLRTAKFADVVMMLLILGVGLFADFRTTCIVAFLVSVMMMLDRIAIFLNNRLISLQDRKEHWRGEGALLPDLKRFCLVYRIDRPLALNFMGDYLRAVWSTTRPKAIFIRMNAVPALDRSALLDLAYQVDRLRNRSVHVYLTGVGETLRKQLDGAGIVERLGAAHVTHRFSDAARLCETELARDPDVRLYEAGRGVGRSVKAIRFRHALGNHVAKESVTSIVSFIGLFVLVMAGYAALAALGWFLLGVLNVLYWLEWVTTYQYIIFISAVFLLAALVIFIRTWREKVLLADPGYYLGREEFFIVHGRSIAGCLLVVPRLLAATMMEMFEFFSRRFHKNTLDTAAMLLVKLPVQITWNNLREGMTDYALYDIRLAMAALRALGFIHYTENKEDFDIELSEEGKAFVQSVEQYAEGLAEQG